MDRYLDRTTLYLYFATLIFAPFARGSVEDWAISIFLMATLTAASASLISRCISWEWQWIKTPLDGPMLSLIILSILSSIFSVHRHSSFWALSLLGGYILFFYLSLTFFQFRTYLRNTQYAVIVIASMLSIFGFIKMFGLNPFSFYEYTNSHQLSSTYVNPNHFAGYIEMALPLLVGTLMVGYRKELLFPMILAALLLMSALAFTLSRGSWISLFCGMMYIGTVFLVHQRMNKRMILMFFGITVMICILILLLSTTLTQRFLSLFEHITNVGGRIIVWRGVVDMIKDYPLLGTGPGTFPFIFSQYQPLGTGTLLYREAHNDYLHFISEIGLFLIPIMAWMVLVLFRHGFQKMKNPSRLIRGITAGAMAGIVSMLVHSIVDFNLHIPANAILFTILVAIVVAPISEHRYPPSKSGHPNKPMHQID